MSTKTAIQFVFKADQMLSICQAGHDILITSYLEEVTTQGGQLVGAMRVKAKSKPSKPGVPHTMAAMDSDGTIFGCPVPPCDSQEQEVEDPK
jgi:hypothetical protein